LSALSLYIHRGLPKSWSNATVGVRRAKLYYLRERVGKATKLRERQETGQKATQSEAKATSNAS
jgi:hypothetical protein